MKRIFALVLSIMLLGSFAFAEVADGTEVTEQVSDTVADPIVESESSGFEYPDGVHPSSKATVEEDGVLTLGNFKIERPADCQLLYETYSDSPSGTSIVAFVPNDTLDGTYSFLWVGFGHEITDAEEIKSMFETYSEAFIAGTIGGYTTQEVVSDETNLDGEFPIRKVEYVLSTAVSADDNTSVEGAESGDSGEDDAFVVNEYLTAVGSKYGMLLVTGDVQNGIDPTAIKAEYDRIIDTLTLDDSIVIEFSEADFPVVSLDGSGSEETVVDDVDAVDNVEDVDNVDNVDSAETTDAE
jgi:hypothetical protein